MPSISVFPDTPRAYNRVDINWADTPAVDFARVLRYNTATGECVPLRPYLCYDGDYLLLSCGHGIFWDTEVPLDVPVYYITEGIDAPCIPAADPCAPCTPVTVDTSASPSTMASGGVFRLRDPVRPCNDVTMPLCFSQDNLATRADGTYCLPGTGVFFASMDTEAYEPNTLILNPTNAKYPIAINRQRRAVASVLTAVTRTFADRDAVLALAQPGSPIMLAAPPEYGIDDTYMSVGTVAVERGLSDHKFQVRTIQMPFTAVARPVGPTQGVCGSQVQDLCDFTWQELDDSGMNWDDLVRGAAGGAAPAFRTWTIGTNTVLGDFADWNAVDNGTRTWTGLAADQ